jgi:hypothetical protein
LKALGKHVQRCTGDGSNDQAAAKHSKWLLLLLRLLQQQQLLLPVKCV